MDEVYTMSRDVMLTPKRISFAREQEMKLFNELYLITTYKQSDIVVSNIIIHIKGIAFLGRKFNFKYAPAASLDAWSSKA